MGQFLSLLSSSYVSLPNYLGIPLLAAQVTENTVYQCYIGR